MSVKRAKTTDLRTTGQVTANLWEFPVCSKKAKHRKISKIGKNVKIWNSQISLYFRYVLACFPLVSDGPWCGFCVIEQNGKYQFSLQPALQIVGACQGQQDASQCTVNWGKYH